MFLASVHIIPKETMFVLIKSVTTHSTSETTFLFADNTKHSNIWARPLHHMSPFSHLMLTFHNPINT